MEQIWDVSTHPQKVHAVSQRQFFYQTFKFRATGAIANQEKMKLFGQGFL